MMSKDEESKAPEAAAETIEALVGLRGSGNTSEYMNGRRAMAYDMVDKGLLSSQKLAHEILYLLPDDFVKFYSELFHMALNVNDGSVMHGRSGGVDKAKGRTSMQLGSQDRGGQASGSGKKWKNTPMAIGNEAALRVKEQMDQGLRDLVRQAVQGMKREQLRKERLRNEALGNGDNGPQGPGALKTQTAQYRCRGTRVTWELGTDGIRVDREFKCGRFMKDEWNFCPTCGTWRTRQGHVEEQER